MKEKIRLKRKNIRQNIVQKAADIFAQFGFKKATMDDIASSMGMGKSTLYYYFKSKEQVFEAVVKKEADILSKKLDEEVLMKDINPMKKLRSYVLIRMNFLNDFVNFFAALKHDYLSNLAFTERVREKYDKEEQQIIQGILEEGIEQGLFDLKETKLSALAIATTMKGLEVAWLIKNELEVVDLERQLDEMLSILFYGIVKKSD